MKLLATCLLLISASTFAQADELDEIPKCKGAIQCEKMWSDAQEVLPQISTMRIRLATNDRLETYPPMRAGSLGATIRKIPIVDQEYEFRISIECYGPKGCSEGLKLSSRRVFNGWLAIQKAANL